MNIKIPQRNSAEIGIAIEEPSGTPKNCTGYECILMVKKQRKLSVDTIIYSEIDWDDISSGIGTFNIPPTDTDIDADSYAAEVILYNDSANYQKSVNTFYIMITESTGKDVI